MILNHKSFSGSSQRNTPIVCQVLQNAEHNHVIFWCLFTFTSNPRLQYKLTYLAKSSVSNTFAQLPLSKRMGYKESCEYVQLVGFWIYNILYGKTFRTDYLCAISWFLVFLSIYWVLQDQTLDWWDPRERKLLLSSDGVTYNLTCSSRAGKYWSEVTLKNQIFLQNSCRAKNSKLPLR